MRRATIYLSQSRCIFENLALEEWLFRKHDFNQFGEALLIWSNKPAVVIGRHQNPWHEANIGYLKENGIKLARRHSGGGTVFHDLGNVNLSFLTEKSRHNRQRNLELVTDVLYSNWGLNLVRNGRHDLLLASSQQKVSGTAARIARKRAYHHFTLMIDVDLNMLRKCLDVTRLPILETKATRSTVAARVGCLSQDGNVDREQIIDAICNMYGRQFQSCKTELISDAVNSYTSAEMKLALEELHSWSWVYGKTPTFSVPSHNLQVEKGVIVKSDNCVLIGKKFDLNLLY